MRNSAFGLVFIGLLALFALIMNYPARLVTASEPTPTPTARPDNLPSDMLCHLAQGKDCTVINPLDMAAGDSRLRFNPAISAINVPTYTLVSLRFPDDMDSRTINLSTFFVTQGAAPIAGHIEYIAGGKMAIFYPAAPLLTNTIYTATVTTGVRTRSDQPLTEAISWHFTTSDTPHVPALGPMALAGNMNIYFGDLHSHTGYSDGQGTPADAFTMARASGLDFFGLTEHAFMLDAAEWQDVLNQANAHTSNGQFVALPGFEYTHALGHINVFGSDTYIQRNDPNTDTLDEFYAWIVAHPTAIGQFNHPNATGYNFNFNNFAYVGPADHKMVLQEITTASQFFLSLNNGWHLGTLKNRDTHQANWGCCPLMGTIAPQLSQAAILEALAARRTFFVSPSDSNLALVLQANGYWMGSAIPNTGSINFAITAHDPDPTGKPLRVFLYDNGVRVAGTSLPATTWYSWTPSLVAQPGHYYYAEAYYDGWLYPAYTSPIWVEQPPVARANPAQFVAPGTTVTLNGSQSYDPDGDTLVYHWSQNSGPSVTLSQANTVQPTFIAPGTLGGLSFQLTVVDPGSLTGSDVTAVTVTDSPILHIDLHGPTQTQPGEPITYTLTVTNTGIANADNVVITNAIPAGAIHLNGGTLMPGNIVSWTVSSLAANGDAAQTSYAVVAVGGIINKDYRATCTGCVPATGNKAVATNFQTLFLPIITKHH